MDRSSPGQPTKYEERFAREAHELCKLGATDVKLAAFFGVSKSTLNTWKHAHPEFLDSLKKGKDEFDVERMEKSLLKRGLGYRFTEVTREACPVFEVRKNEDGTESKVKVGEELAVTKKVTKHIAGDVLAQIFWLKNRTPDRWRDKQEVAHSVTLSVKLQERLDRALEKGSSGGGRSRTKHIDGPVGEREGDGA